MTSLKKYTILPRSFSGGIKNVVERTRDGTIQQEMNQIKSEIARLASSEQQPVYFLDLSAKADIMEYAFTFRGVSVECGPDFAEKIAQLSLVNKIEEITNSYYLADLERGAPLNAAAPKAKKSAGPRR